MSTRGLTCRCGARPAFIVVCRTMKVYLCHAHKHEMFLLEDALHFRRLRCP
jgi:hypothetical protein